VLPCDPSHADLRRTADGPLASQGMAWQNNVTARRRLIGDPTWREIEGALWPNLKGHVTLWHPMKGPLLFE
jgi:hypothetical protein